MNNIVNKINAWIAAFKNYSIYKKTIDLLKMLHPYLIKFSNILYQHRVKLSQFVFGFLAVLVFLGIALPSFFPMIDMVSEIGEDIREGAFRTLFLSIGIFSGVVLFFYFTKNIQLDWKKAWGIIGFLLLVSLFARFWFIFNFEQVYYSDFRTYWRTATDMAENGIKLATNVFISRALPFYTPLIYFFGDSDIVFKTANVILISLSGLITAFLTSRYISHKAAIAVFAIISVFPETYYASLIPTHDITGAYFLMVCLLLAFLGLENVAKEKYKTAFIYVVLLALFMVPLQMQRGLSIMLINGLMLSIVFFGLIRFSDETNWSKKVVFIFAALILIGVAPKELYKVFNSQTQKIIISKSEQSGSAARRHNRDLIRYNTLNSGSYSSQIAGLNNTFVMQIPDIQSRNDFMKSLYLSDTYYDPLERFPNFFLRSHRLYNLSSQMPFYMGRLEYHNQQENREILDKARRLNRSFYAVFLFVLIWASIYIAIKAKRINILVVMSLIFMGILALVFSILFENQPRYLFIGYFIWPIVIAFAFSEKFRDTDEEKTSWQFMPVRYSKPSFYSILFTIGFAVVFYMLFAVGFRNSELKMLNLEKFEAICDSKVEQENCETGILDFKKSLRGRKWGLLRLQLPSSNPKRGQYVKAVQSVNVKNDKLYGFDVFVQHPYTRGDGRTGYFDIVVSANDKSKILHLENTDELQFVRLENISPRNGEIEITLEVKCVRCSAAPSWQRASTTNFQFARLFQMDEPDRKWRASE